MPAQERLRLDDEQGLFPGPNHPCQKHQEDPIPSGIDRSLDLSPEDNQLLSEEGVFCHECGLAPGKVSQRAQQERSGGRFRPVSKALLKELKVYSYQPHHRFENMIHRRSFPFMKKSR